MAIINSDSVMYYGLWVMGYLVSIQFRLVQDVLDFVLLALAFKNISTWCFVV